MRRYQMYPANADQAAAGSIRCLTEIGSGRAWETPTWLPGLIMTLIDERRQRIAQPATLRERVLEVMQRVYPTF